MDSDENAEKARVDHISPAQLTIFSAGKKAGSREAFAEGAKLQKLLAEWTETTFFETKGEWQVWVDEFGPRVEDAIYAFDEARAKGESKVNLEQRKETT